ncbi:helix-turn-helix DNA binding domain protein [Microbacterium phage Fizzles]|nr:helix-turn-helix DNA binding domain protein [Microbacterium phage Fizzles]
MNEPKRVEFDREMTKAEKRNGGAPEKPKPSLKERIPQLPQMPRVDPADLHDSNQRAVACVNLKLAGASFHEIAKELSYRDAASARTAYYSALASIHPVEDIETLRQMEGLRAEALFRSSLAMASAAYLVDEEGNRMVNTDRLRWHEQASKDLALHAAITGAKAPARVEVNASTQEINELVHLLVQERGGGEIEASVWDVTEVEALDAEIVEDEV